MVYSDQLRLLNPALPDRQPLYLFGYAMDPDPVMSCPRLSPSARLVYRAVLRLCGRGTVCKTAVDRIASQAGVSVRSVQRHIATLTRLALIETEGTPGSETIFRLLPLPAWLVEGRRPVLKEETTGPQDYETTGPETHPVRGPVVRGPVVCRSAVNAPFAPEGRQPDGGEAPACQGRGDSLAPPMSNKKLKRENPISLSGHGTQSGTEWTDPPAVGEREEAGEAFEPVIEKTTGPQDHETTRPEAHQVCGPVVSGLVVSAPPTAHQIVQATCRTLGFRPTQAQVGFGVREVAALCAGGFSLTEIGEGARYAAERGWVRSFAGVKFYLPQALKALKKKDHKTTGHETTRPDPHPVRGPVVCRSAPSPHRDLWDQVLGKIEKRIRPQSYRTWFVPTQIGDFDGGRAVLRVPSHLFTDWLKAHYLALIEAAFEEVLGRKAEVFFETPEGGG